MKSTELIESSDDQTKPNEIIAKKKFKKNAVLDRLIGQLQRKVLSKQDIKLLEVLGFSETVKILKEE